jgi:hypothetical protein
MNGGIKAQSVQNLTFASLNTPRKQAPGYVDLLSDIYSQVISFNCPNFLGARIPLPTNFNLPVWKAATADYHDSQVVDFLTFGWPVSYQGPIPTQNHVNHPSALKFPQHVLNFTIKEVQEGAMLGPFQQPLFRPWAHMNPILTRPKKQSTERRVILDLSFPKFPGCSVNAGTPTDTYLGQPLKLTLPSAMDLAKLIVDQGKGCYVFGTDVARAYRQLPLDPADWPLINFRTPQGFFTDISLPFGLRWAAMACQRSLSVVVHVCQKQGVTLVLYIDDLAGAAVSYELACQQFHLVQQVMCDLGIQEARHKASPPAQSMVWLGLLFDTINMTISIPKDKIVEVLDLLQAWRVKTSATRKQLQSILGKLFHVGQCIAPARKFVNRMLTTMRACPVHGRIILDDDFKKDLQWFVHFMPSTNGVYLLDQTWREPVSVVVDSCLTGAGAACIDIKQAYQFVYPLDLLQRKLSICQLECLNALAAIRLWAPQFVGRCVELKSDSAAAVAVLQAGRGRDQLLQAAARELWLISALNHLNVRVTHVPGASLLSSADALSRAHTHVSFKLLADQFCVDNNIVCTNLVADKFQLPLNW